MNRRSVAALLAILVAGILLSINDPVNGTTYVCLLIGWT
jgi:hypothetical protein